MKATTEKRTERYMIEWRTLTAVDPDTGDWNPDGDEYAREFSYDIDAAIYIAKRCPCDQGPVHISRQVLRDEICGDDNFGPRWEYDSAGVLIAVEGDDVTDYR